MADKPYVPSTKSLPRPTAIMRAPTFKEKAGNIMRDFLSSMAEQPLARIGDALGISGIKELSQPDSSGIKQGMMVGGPGKGIFGAAKPAYSVERGIKTPSGKLSLPDYDANMGNVSEPLAARIARRHGDAVDPQGNIDWGSSGNHMAEDEVNNLIAQQSFSSPVRPGYYNTSMASPAPNQFELSRHAIDPNVMPSGTMTFADPELQMQQTLANHMTPEPKTRKAFGYPVTERYYQSIFGK